MLDGTAAHSNDRETEMPLGLSRTEPVWRSVHYLGSKFRIVDAIRTLVGELSPAGDVVCDLFAGSGTVALALSARSRVVAADIQEYSRVLCSALLHSPGLTDAAVTRFLESVLRRVRELEACVEPLLEYEEKAVGRVVKEPDLLCDLAEHGSLLSDNPAGGALGKAIAETLSRVQKHPASFLATRYYGGVYFSYRQALYLDSVLESIELTATSERDTYLAALLSTASSLVNSVGKQFAQPMRPRRADGSIKRHVLLQMCRDRGLDANQTFGSWLRRYRELPPGGRHQIIRGDYRDVLARLENVSVIYADPPYTRDHYSRFYHVLETLCLRDDPELSTTSIRGKGRVSRGLYRADRHQSPFCIRSQAPGAFADLIRGARKLGAPLLLSYSPYVKDGHPRLMTIEAIVRTAREYYREVDVKPVAALVHSKLNKSDLHREASPNAEVFIVCRP